MRKVCFVFSLFLGFLFCYSYSFADSLQKAVQKAAHANKVQAERIKIISENMANENSTGMLPGQAPYTRQVLFVKNTYDKKHKTNLLKIKKQALDKKSKFKYRHEPSHPAADINGFVQYPNVDIEIERIDAADAQKSYEANLSVIEVSKAMIKSTLELMKR